MMCRSKRLRRQREFLQRRMDHLKERAKTRPESCASFDRTEAAALATALEFFDAGIARESAAIESRASATLDEWVATLQALHAWISNQPANITRIIAAEDTCDDLLDELEHFRDEAPEAE